MKLFNTVLGLCLSKFLKRPFYLRFHITHRCNYHCRMCGIHNGSKFLSNELTLPEIHIVAERLASMGAKHLVLTGGEPSLRSDLPDIISVFKKHHFSVRLQTNGSAVFSEDLLFRCSRAGLDDVSVSIDTLDRGLQDQICRSSGVVENALRTIKLTKKVLPGSISQANIVASKYNFQELPFLVNYFYKMGVYTYITPVMISIDGEKNSHEYQFRGREKEGFSEGIDEATTKRVIDELIIFRRRGQGLTNSIRFLEDYRDYLDQGQCVWRCEAGTLCLDVLPDGGVSICKEKSPFGNILDPDFQRFYRSPEYWEQTNAVTSTCKGCFYGEYREPQYAIRDLSVLKDWVRNWLSTFRHGMRFKN